jgi:hypothetical protein
MRATINLPAELQQYYGLQLLKTEQQVVLNQALD